MLALSVGEANHEGDEEETLHVGCFGGVDEAVCAEAVAHRRASCERRTTSSTAEQRVKPMSSAQRSSVAAALVVGSFSPVVL